MPSQSHPIGITVKDSFNQLLGDASVVLTYETNVLSGTTDSDGRVIINLGDITIDWEVGDEVSITASKTYKGTKTESLILTSEPQEITIKLEETSDFVYEDTGMKQIKLNAVMLFDFEGNKVTSLNPVPVKTSDILAEYQSADTGRVGEVRYAGFTRLDGGWYIRKSDDSNRENASRRYASGNSNYPANWTGRTSLTYKRFNEVFG